MKVTIKAIDGNHVTLTAGDTEFEADWQGDVPAIGSDAVVELELDATLTWGVDIVTADQALADSLQGVLEDYWEDDAMALVRVAGGLLQVETKGDPPAKGTAVRFVPSGLEVYDTKS